MRTIFLILSIVATAHLRGGATYYYNNGKKIEIERSTVKKGGAIRYRNNRGGELITNGRVIVSFKKNLSDDQRKALLQKYRGVLIKDEITANGEIIIFKTTLDPVEVANQLYETEKTRFSEPDLMIPHIKWGFNDPYLGRQWHLDEIGAPDAWKRTTGKKSIKIAILDDGAALNHPDLNIVASQDFSGAGFFDGGEHGTACAGLAAGTANNGQGISGVCPDCGLMVAKIMDEDGMAPVSSDRDAFFWASNNGARVISCSWGFPGNINVPDYLKTAIEQLTESGCGGKGCVILFAAGNDNHRFNLFDGIQNLEELRAIIAVGAVDQYGQKTSYSNYGKNLWISAPSGDQNILESPYIGVATTDFYQPGSADLKGYNRGGTGYSGGEAIGTDIDPTGAYTRFFSGTSAATPIAAGVVGLLLSYRPELTPEEVKSVLRESAVKTAGDHDENGHSDRIGYGVIHAEYALEYARCYGSDGSGEHCGNGRDDDCDDLIDLDDPDCSCDQLSCPGESRCIIAPEDGYPHCACPDGKIWSGEQCEPISCAHLQCEQRGESCISEAIPYCSCPEGALRDGTTGLCKEIDCTQTVCEHYFNSSSCELINGVSSCICTEGASSVPCTMVTPCQGFDCGAGTCYAPGGVATCICPEGYHNVDNSCVQGVKDLCLGIGCGSGSCIVQSGKARCLCSSGYLEQGLKCVAEPDEDDCPDCCQYSSMHGSGSRGVFWGLFLVLLVLRRKVQRA